MWEFQILKNFDVQIHPPRPKILKEVLWYPPLVGWIKLNIDGASGGSPIKVACGGMLRNHLGKHLGNFACNLPPINAFFVEITGAILAMEWAFLIIGVISNWSRIPYYLLRL